MTRRPKRAYVVALVFLGFVILVGGIMLIIGLAKGDTASDDTGDPTGLGVVVERL